MTKPESPPALADAAVLAGDSGALRDRLAADGCLFFPGLLDPGRVAAVREDVLRALAEAGWLEPRSDPLEARPGPLRRRFGEDAWWGGYVAIQRLESFHRLAHDERITEVMAALLGEELLVMPMKIARVSFPGAEHPTAAHQDHFHVGGTVDALTAWVPLGDCPPELGGLHVVPGSHRGGLRGVRPAAGEGGYEVIPDATDQPARTAGYRAGDVLLFHSLLVHLAPPNRGDRLRLSADYRYQWAGDPINPSVLFPHEFGRGSVPHWGELTRGWESTDWIAVPEQVRIGRWLEASPQQSRLF